MLCCQWAPQSICTPEGARGHGGGLLPWPTHQFGVGLCLSPFLSGAWERGPSTRHCSLPLALEESQPWATATDGKEGVTCPRAGRSEHHAAQRAPLPSLPAAPQGAAASAGRARPSAAPAHPSAWLPRATTHHTGAGLSWTRREPRSRPGKCVPFRKSVSGQLCVISFVFAALGLRGQ